jgi:hypothetical protein
MLVRDIESGELFIGHDSGCSCPTPFEDVRSLGDLEHVRSHEDLNRAVRNHASERHTNTVLRDFLVKGLEALKKGS